MPKPRKYGDLCSVGLRIPCTPDFRTRYQKMCDERKLVMTTHIREHLDTELAEYEGARDAGK